MDIRLWDERGSGLLVLLVDIEEQLVSLPVPLEVLPELTLHVLYLAVEVQDALLTLLQFQVGGGTEGFSVLLELQKLLLVHLGHPKESVFLQVELYLLLHQFPLAVPVLLHCLHPTMGPSSSPQPILEELGDLLVLPLQRLAVALLVLPQPLTELPVLLLNLLFPFPQYII